MDFVDPPTDLKLRRVHISKGVVSRCDLHVLGDERIFVIRIAWSTLETVYL